MKKHLLTTVTLAAAIMLKTVGIQAQGSDTLPCRRIGGALSVMPGRAVSIDNYQKKWMRGQSNMAIDAKISYRALPQDSDDFARDYGYPTLSLGLRVQNNHGVTMHKQADAAWPLIEEADYDTQMGNIVSAYLQFDRPLWRTPHWETVYTLAAGTGYSHRKYDKTNNIDNELIGARWLIFFGAGLRVTRSLSTDWGLSAGLEFYHHSNGAMNRPNKGANIVSPHLGLVYQPYHRQTCRKQTKGVQEKRPFSPYLYANVGYALGMRTLLEDWLHTQYELSPSDEDYRTSHFKTYATHAWQADVMCRYARRWASGVGIDVFYGNYYRRAEEMNRRAGHEEKLDPWSLGVSAKHEVFWHRLSLAMSVGMYLHRNMGQLAKEQEQPYYERIGLAYQVGPLKLGANVKAHKTKADLTEITVSLPLHISTL